MFDTLCCLWYNVFVVKNYRSLQTITIEVVETVPPIGLSLFLGCKKLLGRRKGLSLN